MVTKEEILNKISPKQIMEFYTGYNIQDNKAKYKNPLRPDRNGTCYFKQYSKSYLLVDPADSEYTVDCFGLVMKMYNLTFYEALLRINNDLNLGAIIPIVNTEPVVSIQSTTEFDVKLRHWEKEDREYWAQYSVSLYTLDRLNIAPVEYYKIKSKADSSFRSRYSYGKDDSIFDPCYCMTFVKRKTRCKMYRPLALNSQDKWESNVSRTDIMGWDLAESSKDKSVLYVTSGVKDLACITDAGYVAIAPQSETQDISRYIIELGYKLVIVIYDNDETGIKYSDKLVSNLTNKNVRAVNNTKRLSKYEVKDIADYCYNMNDLKDLLKLWQ